MSFGKLNEKNPLAKYKRSDIYLPWLEIERQTGLSHSTVIALAKKTYEEMLKVNLGTYLVFKEKLGVDLLNFDKEVVVEDNIEKNED